MNEALPEEEPIQITPESAEVVIVVLEDIKGSMVNNITNMGITIMIDKAIKQMKGIIDENI